MLSPPDAPGVDMADFEPGAITDPSRLHVASMCSVVADPACTAAFPHRISCRLRVVTVDGDEILVEVPQSRGYPGSQLTWDEIQGKVLRLDPDRAPHLIDRVARITDLATVSDLVG
jgi:2-methylcitrate dehydratase PrpD